jgi:hypothetical protein
MHNLDRPLPDRRQAGGGAIRHELDRRQGARCAVGSGSRRHHHDRAHFTAPNGLRTSSAFATITSTLDPRQLELGIKVLWHHRLPFPRDTSVLATRLAVTTIPPRLSAVDLFPLAAAKHPQDVLRARVNRLPQPR